LAAENQLSGTNQTNPKALLYQELALSLPRPFEGLANSLMVVIGAKRRVQPQW
jgi:hypothetical protein